MIRFVPVRMPNRLEGQSNMGGAVAPMELSVPPLGSKAK